MKNMAAILTTVGKPWTSLIFYRCVNTSAPLSARGVRHVLRGFNVREEDIQDMDADDLDFVSSPDMESMKQQYSQIEFDAKRYQDHVRRKTIEQKYFRKYKPKEENLLTWAMKEQLRYLHSTDPDMWTPGTLAKTFPVSPDGAKKLLKVKWTIKNETDIAKHDRAVAARWKKHMKGQLGSPRLLEHTFDIKSSMETHPVPVLGPDQILSTLQSLEFHGDEEPPSAKALRTRNKLPKAPKIKSGSFSSILKDYELQLSQLSKKNKEEPYNSTSPNVPTRHDISTIISGTPKYEGTYTQVAHPASHKPKGPKKLKKRGKMMTFSDFIKDKTV